MFMRTERLFLRPGWAEDAAELARAIGREDVVRMLARVPWPYTEEHAREWLGQARPGHLPDLLVTLPERNGAIIGAVGLHEDAGAVEVGYWIAPGHWRKGYASEALGGLLSVARALGHRRIKGRHASDNPASGSVLRKAGFRPTSRTGTMHSLGRGGTVASPEYALDLVDGGGSGDNDGGVEPAPMPRFTGPPSSRLPALAAA